MPIDKLKNKFFIGSWVNDVKQYFTKINEIIDYLNNSSIRGKECIIFLESQLNTDDPIVSFPVNTFGVTPTVTRDDVGNYWVTATGVFLEGKTICEADNKSADTFGKITIQRSSDDLITFQTYNYTDTQSDNMILNNWIKITVYP